jgi:hypothetical protein
VSVVTVEVFQRDDPNGTPVATLTDEDLSPDDLFRDAENEHGTIQLRLRRDHPSLGDVRPGMYAKVTVPAIDPDPIFGGWLDNAKDIILASNEETTEYRQLFGPGPIAILRHGALLDDHYSTNPQASDARGNYDVDGNWTWEGEPYGAILTRIVEEGQDQPGTPLEDVTIDFTRSEDSANDPWPEVGTVFQQGIGTDILNVYGALVDTGQLYVRPRPNLLIQAYGTSSYGTDRTSTSFGAGKVRFVKGVNILTELSRDSSMASPTPRRGRQGRPGPATHALVVGKDNVFVQVVSPTYVSGPGRWMTVPYGESDDPDLLEQVGLEALARRAAGEDALTFEILPGDDPTNGYYLPYKHFSIGDLVTLHTGTGASDYDDYSGRVTGISCSIPDATDDGSALMEDRSLRWVVELNGGGTTGSISQGNSGGCCPPPPPYKPVEGQACSGATPSGFYPPLNSFTTQVGDIAFYARPGTPAPSAPITSPHNGLWNFGELGTGGADDIAGFLAGNALAIIVVGDGHLSVDIPVVGGAHTTTWGLTHTPGGADEATGTVDGGSTLEVDVSTHDGAECVHILTVSLQGASGIKLGYGGATWTQAGAVLNSPSLNQTTHEAIDGVAASTTLTTNYPYVPGSLIVTVAGVRIAATETDPTAGEFTLPIDTTGMTVVVHYQVASPHSPTGAGNTNTIPTTATVIPHQLLGTGGDGSGDHVLLDDGTWVDASSLSSATHEADPTDAHDASAISLLDAAGNTAETNVEDAIAELYGLTGIRRPVMAQDPSDSKWYVVVDGDGTAVMAQ